MALPFSSVSLRVKWSWQGDGEGTCAVLIDVVYFALQIAELVWLVNVAGEWIT
jgi:hypothetical protein